MSENQNGFEDKLSAILSNPEALSGILNIAKNLGNEQNNKAKASNTPGHGKQAPIETDVVELESVMAHQSNEGTHNKASADSLALLCAIKPFLDFERASRLDKIMQILKILSITDLFK